MAVTPYPQNLFHAGAAKPLKLHTPLVVSEFGDFGIQVTGNASLQGWPPIFAGQKMVITIGRGTEYEQKFLISSVSSGASESTLLVKAEDRNYDGMLPVNCPAGTAVEHTVSATEMATINDHMRTKRAHGSDGDLVDQASAQTLSNKTLDAPRINGDAVVSGPLSVSDAIADGHAATLRQVKSVETKATAAQTAASSAQTAASTAQTAANNADANANARVAKIGDRMTGVLDMGGHPITNVGIGDTDNDVVRGDQLALVQQNAEWRIARDGDTMTGRLTLNAGLNVTDAGIPPTVPSSPIPQEVRWMVYGNDGTVRRIPHSIWLLQVAAAVGSSSATRKTGIGDPGSTPNVLDLTPRKFTWTDGSEAIFPGERYGLIAEEVAAVDRRLAMTDPDGHTATGLDQHALIAALIQTVKDLSARVEALEAQP